MLWFKDDQQNVKALIKYASSYKGKL